MGTVGYARCHEYLVSGEKGVEDAKERQFVFVLRKANLCAVYGVATAHSPGWQRRARKASERSRTGRAPIVATRLRARPQ